MIGTINEHAQTKYDPLCPAQTHDVLVLVALFRPRRHQFHHQIHRSGDRHAHIQGVQRRTRPPIDLKVTRIVGRDRVHLGRGQRGFVCCQRSLQESKVPDRLARQPLCTVDEERHEVDHHRDRNEGPVPRSQDASIKGGGFAAAAAAAEVHHRRFLLVAPMLRKHMQSAHAVVVVTRCNGRKQQLR